MTAPTTAAMTAPATAHATPSPDLFHDVHKGIRRALFETCVALGRAGSDAARTAHAHQLLRDTLRFVAHHGDNEDALLLPLLAGRRDDVVASMRAAHERIDAELAALRDALAAPDAPASCDALYARAASFTARYLEHMREEEEEHDALIRAALSPDELASFGRASVARTAPDDQLMMIGWMLPALAPASEAALRARLPPALAARFR